MSFLHTKNMASLLKPTLPLLEFETLTAVKVNHSGLFKITVSS